MAERYEAETSGIALIPVEGGEKRKLISGPLAGGHYRLPSFSPDGRLLAYSLGQGIGDIYLLELGADLKPKRQPQRLTRQAGSVQWHHLGAGREVRGLRSRLLCRSGQQITCGGCPSAAEGSPSVWSWPGRGARIPQLLGRATSWPILCAAAAICVLTFGGSRQAPRRSASCLPARWMRPSVLAGWQEGRLRIGRFGQRQRHLGRQSGWIEPGPTDGAGEQGTGQPLLVAGRPVARL